MSTHPIERTYDRLAPIYGIWGELTETAARRRVLEVAALRPGESVLEVAVGTGEFYSRLLGMPGLRQCVGIELSSGMLRRARRRLLKNPGPGGELCRADARRMPFQEETFDAILNCYMLDLLPEAEIPTVLGEFRRASKPTGRLALLVMDAQNRLVNPIWMWMYRHAPALVGGCRPVALAGLLAGSGWRVEHDELIVQNGFRSKLILARPAGAETRAA
jgi:ubiquinone/menaquinone biosynthesis C-methylase UbiE